MRLTILVRSVHSSNNIQHEFYKEKTMKVLNCDDRLEIFKSLDFEDDFKNVRNVFNTDFISVVLLISTSF